MQLNAILCAKHCFWIVWIMALLPGCATSLTERPPVSEYKCTASYAVSPDLDSALREAFHPLLTGRTQQSAFRILETGEESLEARLALVEAATHSIDLQYFTINDDLTSNLLLQSIIQAAERGVRVRFIIDNTSMKDTGTRLSALDGIKNIEIRVFNPIVTKDQPFLSHRISWIVNFDQAVKRMHNKAMIIDNQMAILGGRNLGDEYFDASTNIDFKDIDILAEGPINPEI